MKRRVDILLATEVPGGFPRSRWRCSAHRMLTIDNRPPHCEDCRRDLVEAWRAAVRINEWLIRWRDEARQILEAVIEGRR